MPEQETTIDETSLREAWLNRLIEELEKVDAAMPVKNLLPENDGPAWVQKLEGEVAKALLPAARLKNEPTRTPRLMGAILGHQCSSAVWMMEWLAAASVKHRPTSVGRPSTEQIKEGKRIVVGLTEEWFEGLRNLAKLALSSCVDLSYADMKEFLLAYAAGFAQKPDTVGDIGHSAFRIYFFMLFQWRLVERLNSVRELHELLIKIFGANQVGELKRIEKICQRIGLHYRKPGRPKKLQ